MEDLPFGTYIRQLRDDANVPLRKLAAALDIDTSTLSKIERTKRYASSEMIPIIADFFALNEKLLTIKFLCDKLLRDLKNEKYAIEALEETIKKLKP